MPFLHTQNECEEWFLAEFFRVSKAN